jgi:hypothetical protein
MAELHTCPRCNRFLALLGWICGPCQEFLAAHPMAKRWGGQQWLNPGAQGAGAMKRWFLKQRSLWQQCPWCHGTGIFHPHLPMACPRCKGTGKR